MPKQKVKQIEAIGTWLDRVTDQELANLFGSYDVQATRLRLVSAMRELAHIAHWQGKNIYVVEERTELPWVEIGDEPINSWRDVTAKWIEEQMADINISNKEVSADLDMHPTLVSAYKNGSKPLNPSVQQKFYYYFYQKAAQKFTK